jgi:hypothetical protein
LTHLWQRFLLASALVVGLAIGVAATVFGYSNLSTVNLHWSVFHLNGVPLWTVAVVPITLLLVAGTLYHWLDGLHHFSEHMRHRHRVHELEAEVARLRAHLDQVLEMPQSETGRRVQKASLPAADLAAADDAMSGLDSDDVAPKPASFGDSEPVDRDAKAVSDAKPLSDAKPADAEPKPASDAKPVTERRKRGRFSLAPKSVDDAAPDGHTNGHDTEPALPASEA